MGWPARSRPGTAPTRNGRRRRSAPGSKLACRTEPIDRPPLQALLACAGKPTAACLGLDGAPRIIQPEGRHAHPRGCAAIDAALWDEWLNRWYHAELDAAPPPGREALRRAERAWLACRDAACAAEGVIASWPLGADNAATCRMEQTAWRALELRRIGEEIAVSR